MLEMCNPEITPDGATPSNLIWKEGKAILATNPNKTNKQLK